MTKAHRRTRQRKAVYVPPSRKPREKKEVAPDLWDPRVATRIPSNPNFRKHDPEYKYIIDAQGNRVPVIKGTIVALRASSVGLEEIRKLQEPQLAPELWNGSQHYMLTHALRLFQACTVTTSRNDDPASPNTRRLIEGITPARLLLETGLLPEQVPQVIQALEQARLLTSRGRIGKTPIWLVDMLVKGIGSKGKKYQVHELLDGWALPEFAPVLPGTSTNVKGVETMARRATGQRHMRTDEEYRKVLQAALDALKTLVPDGTEPDAEGRIFFSFEGSAVQLLSRQPGRTTAAAQKVLVHLKSLGLTEGISSSRGVSRRWIRPEGEVTLKMVRRVRKDDANRQAAFMDRKLKRKSGPKTRIVRAKPPVAAASADAGVSATPEQLVEIINKLTAKLEERDTRIEQLEESLRSEREVHKATRAELEAARSAPRTVVVLPEGVAKYLN